MSTKPSDVSAAESDADRTLTEGVSRMLTSLEPVIRHEGGRARLMAIKEGIARLELGGDFCEGCSAALAGMEGGLRLMLLERVTGLKEVIFV